MHIPQFIKRWSGPKTPALTPSKTKTSPTERVKDVDAYNLFVRTYRPFGRRTPDARQISQFVRLMVWFMNRHPEDVRLQSEMLIVFAQALIGYGVQLRQDVRDVE